MRHDIKMIITYAISNKIYRKIAPSDVLLSMKVVRSTLLAAYALRKSTSTEAIVNSSCEKLMPVPFDYCRNVVEQDLWDNFPRSLSYKEYCCPYLVFKKLFKKGTLNQWIGALENLVEGALSSHKIGEEVGGEINIVRIYNWLLKLMEAAHLVWIRVVLRKLNAQKANENDKD